MNIFAALPFAPYQMVRKFLAYASGALALGTNTLTAYTADADKAEFHKRLAFAYTGTVTNVTVTIGVKWAGTTYNLITFATLTSGRWVEFVPELWMYDADQWIFTITNATAGNTFAVNFAYFQSVFDK